MISIIVPVYNEEENIGLLADSIFSAIKDCGLSEIIFVDDGSKDNSYSILQAIAQDKPSAKIIRLARNSGQTAAIQAGIDHAHGDILIFIDADLQNDPADIPKLINKLNEGYDVVSGWREKRKDNALKRNFPSRLANSLISKISGVSLHDYGCTLKAYRSTVIKNVRLYGEMHRFIPIYAVWQGAKIAELPVAHHPRKFGVSKYGLERIFKVLLDILVIKFLERYLVKPIYIFGGCGLFAFLLATIAFTWAFGLKYINGISLIQTPLPLFGSISILVGFLCILMGLLAEMLSRTYHESQDRKSYIVRETCNMQNVTSKESQCAE